MKTLGEIIQDTIKEQKMNGCIINKEDTNIHSQEFNFGGLRIPKHTIDKCILFADILEDELENYGTYEEHKDTINFMVGYFRKHKNVFYGQ